MVASTSHLSSSATPTQKTFQPHFPNQGSAALRSSLDRDGPQQTSTSNTHPRTLSTSAMSYTARGSSLNISPGPGSFSSELRSQNVFSKTGSRAETGTMSMERLEEDGPKLSQQLIASLKGDLAKELKIKEGSENMLEAITAKKQKGAGKDYRGKIEAELTSTNQRIKNLRAQISDLQQARLPPPSTPTRHRLAGLFSSNGQRSPSSIARSTGGSDLEEPAESPTFALSEILQHLEAEGLTPDYYVGHANNLVELFKKYPTLKYDLVWSIFGLRMQVMLLSDSREVVAAGYRMTRHAITDIASLQKIRALNTDYLVSLSLIKERKADVEREQALKLVRAFLEVKDGVHELSRAIVRTVASVAEHGEDRLKAICLETLAEVMIKDPSLLIASGGLRPLIDALREGAYEASEGLVSAFLYLLDAPQRRVFLRPGHELEVLFMPFTDSLSSPEKLLKQNARAISSAMKSWPGLLTLSMFDFRAIKSLIQSLALPSPTVRETVIDLVFSLLRIKPPSWSTSYLAGRRLTTYGRVANLKATTVRSTTTVASDDDAAQHNIMEHYTALLLAILISSDMLANLLLVTKDSDNQLLQRKATLLIGEVLKLADKLLPPSWSDDLQLLPELFAAASHFGSEERHVATGTLYQIDSVNRTLYRSAPTAVVSTINDAANTVNSDSIDHVDEPSKGGPGMLFDEATFRQMMIETQVLTHHNYLKWNWEMILKVIEGPLLNGKRLDEAIKVSKFFKRLASFYRPFKYKFADVRNTRPNQKYVKVGCALMNTLLQTAEGVKYLAEHKLLRQLAECLAQCDPSVSGLTAHVPMFAAERVSETLCGGYFAMLGVLSSDKRGLQMLDRWKIFNMFYRILDLKTRTDLAQLLLSNLDYSLDGHPRILLSKALTAANKDVRIYATNVLRKYSKPRSKTGGPSDVCVSKWAIQLLVTQLYDPEVEVCSTAVKILEEACNNNEYLEYVVECRPSLDHLGEIGAPLLLRFLSTSIGYHYLDGLDYISNEMDDWFLGGIDTYVGKVEAKLARAFMEPQDESSGIIGLDDDLLEQDRLDNDGKVPEHFYRELARTKEGCKLLRDKGHFEEFTTIILEQGRETEDPEVILKVKGSLWAVGNIGSQELGAAFLEESDLVGAIVDIAENHPIMSMRGTAFFVLGLISKSIHGLEIISEYGWDSNTDNMGKSIGFCIPTDLSKLFSYTPWKHEQAADITLKDTQVSSPTSIGKVDDDPFTAKVLKLIATMGNTVLSQKAADELRHMKQKKAEGLHDPDLFRRVMLSLESHHFRLPVRRFVADLFDRSVLRKIVLGEESSSEEEASGDDSETATERQRSISVPTVPTGLK